MFETASEEARKAFGNGDMFVEQFFSDARHIEVGCAPVLRILLTRGSP